MRDLVERLESETKSTKRKRGNEKRRKADEDFKGGFLDDEAMDVETPKKKQKFSAVSTPRKIRTPSKLLTPSHKRSYLLKLFP